MPYYDPFHLLGLPLSAYTPGQGDAKMEGGYETATGAPVYTFEDWLAGKAPYVTGATSMRPTGQTVYRTVGDQRVPVRITDYGPGVKGIDIASANKEWATNFPHQGQTDSMTSQDAITNLIGPPPTTAPGFTQGSNPAQMSTFLDYAKELDKQKAYDKAGSAIGSAFAGLGNQISQQSQQGMNQAMQMLQKKSSGASYLHQLLLGAGNNYPDYSTYFGG